MPSRAETAAALEACGVVAVIRLKEAGVLRAVLDALAEGGVRALEVTMTVPRASELIGEVAPTLPEGTLLGAGTVLAAAAARGFREVRIVHGRGVGTQRTIVRAVLARSPLVEEFRDAPPERGGWGATVALLRSAPPVR